MIKQIFPTCVLFLVFFAVGFVGGMAVLTIAGGMSLVGNVEHSEVDQ